MRSLLLFLGFFFDKMAPYVAKMTQGWNGARGTAS